TTADRSGCCSTRAARTLTGSKCVLTSGREIASGSARMSASSAPGIRPSGGGCGATAATCRPATCASISDSERRRASRQLSSNGRMDRPNDGRTFGETAWSRFAAAQDWHHEDREGHGDQRTTKLTKTTKKTLAAGLWLGGLRRS